MPLILPRRGDRFLAHKNGTAQTGLSSGAFVAISFGTSVYNVGGRFASSIWTPRQGGVALSGRADISGNTLTTSSVQLASIFKNGTEWKRFGGYPINNTGYAVALYAEDEANGTDAYEMRVYAFGSTLAVGGGAPDTWFAGCQI